VGVGYHVCIRGNSFRNLRGENSRPTAHELLLGDKRRKKNQKKPKKNLIPFREKERRGKKWFSHKRKSPKNRPAWSVDRKEGRTLRLGGEYPGGSSTSDLSESRSKGSLQKNDRRFQPLFRKGKLVTPTKPIGDRNG